MANGKWQQAPGFDLLHHILQAKLLHVILFGDTKEGLKDTDLIFRKKERTFQFKHFCQREFLKTELCINCDFFYRSWLRLAQ